MASLIFDDFNGYVVGDWVSDLPNWAVHVLSGDSIRVDLHNDHSDGTNVVDYNPSSGETLSVYQTTLDHPNHSVEIQCYLDVFVPTSDGHVNQYGPLARVQTIDPTLLSGYGLVFMNVNPSGVLAAIWRWDSGSPTQLAVSGDISGELYGDVSVSHYVELQAIDNDLFGYVDSNLVVSTTDTTYSSGNAAGVFSRRGRASVDSQPFFDNFTAEILSTPPPPATTINVKLDGIFQERALRTKLGGVFN